MSLTFGRWYYLDWFVPLRFPITPGAGPTFTWSLSGEPYGKASGDAGKGGMGDRRTVGENERPSGAPLLRLYGHNSACCRRSGRRRRCRMGCF